MNLREIAGGQPPNRALQAKIQQQSRQIEHLKEENQWLREQLRKATEKADEKRPPFGKRK